VICDSRAGGKSSGVGSNGDLSGVVRSSSRVLDGKSAAKEGKHEGVLERQQHATSSVVSRSCFSIRARQRYVHGGSGGDVGDPGVGSGGGGGKNDLKLSGGKGRRRDRLGKRGRAAEGRGGRKGRKVSKRLFESLKRIGWMREVYSRPGRWNLRRSCCKGREAERKGRE